MRDNDESAGFCEGGDRSNSSARADIDPLPGGLVARPDSIAGGEVDRPVASREREGKRGSAADRNCSVVPAGHIGRVRGVPAPGHDGRSRAGVGQENWQRSGAGCLILAERYDNRIHRAVAGVVRVYGAGSFIKNTRSRSGCKDVVRDRRPGDCPIRSVDIDPELWNIDYVETVGSYSWSKGNNSNPFGVPDDIFKSITRYINA